MRLNRHSLNIFLELKKLTGFDVNFDSIITIGRQGIHEKKEFLEKFFTQKKHSFSAGENNYCEDFFKSLGSEIIDSIDYSNFEGATVIQDMNDNIDVNLENRYDLVIDGGSLEHIFDFKTAISNCMKLVKKGGYFIGIFPTNNYSNHGFYQFSPELFFRCFSKSNGFKKGRLFIYQEKERLNLYEMKDPDDYSRRFQFRSIDRTMCFFISQKIAIKELFKEKVLQSDYKKIWDSQQLTPNQNFNSRSIKFLKKIFPRSLKKRFLALNGFFKMLLTGYDSIDNEGFKKII